MKGIYTGSIWQNVQLGTSMTTAEDFFLTSFGG